MRGLMFLFEALSLAHAGALAAQLDGAARGPRDLEQIVDEAHQRHAVFVGHLLGHDHFLPDGRVGCAAGCRSKEQRARVTEQGACGDDERVDDRCTAKTFEFGQW